MDRLAGIALSIHRMVSVRWLHASQYIYPVIAASTPTNLLVPRSHSLPIVMQTRYIKRSYVTGGRIGYTEGGSGLPHADESFTLYNSSSDPQMRFSNGHRSGSYSYVQRSTTGHPDMPMVFEQFYSGSIAGSPNEDSDPPPPYTAAQAFVSQDHGRSAALGTPRGYEEQGYTSDPETYSDNSYGQMHAHAQDFHVHPMSMLASLALKARAPHPSQDRKRTAQLIRIVPDAPDMRESQRESDTRPQRKASSRYESFLQEQDHEAKGAKHRTDEDVEDLSDRFATLPHQFSEREAVKSPEGPMMSRSGNWVGCAAPRPPSPTPSTEAEKPRERSRSQESSPQAAPTPCKPLAPAPVYSSTITVVNGRSSRSLRRVSFNAKEGDWETPPSATIGPCMTDTFIVLAGESGRCEGKVMYKLHNGGKVTLSFVCSSDVNEVSITPEVYRDLFKLKFKRKAPLICTLTALEIDDDAPKSAVDPSPPQAI